MLLAIALLFGIWAAALVSVMLVIVLAIIVLLGSNTHPPDKGNFV